MLWHGTCFLNSIHRIGGRRVILGAGSVICSRINARTKVIKMINLHKSRFCLSVKMIIASIRNKEYNVFARKYFYPLCSEYQPYQHLPGSGKDNLPVADKIKNEVLCLPFYGALGKENVGKICEIIRFIRGRFNVVSYKNKSPQRFEQVHQGK